MQGSRRIYASFPWHAILMAHTSLNVNISPSSPDIVTVIDYSFPEYDKKVVDLFSRSMGPNTILQVVTRCERNEDENRKRKAILSKIKKLFPMLKEKINIYLNGFEGYIDNHAD